MPNGSSTASAPTSIIFAPISVPPFSSFEEAQQVFVQQIQSLQNSLVNQLPILNFGGSRLANVGAPQYLDDVVTLRYLYANGQQVITGSATSAQAGGNPSGARYLLAVNNLGDVENVLNAAGNLLLGQTNTASFADVSIGTDTSVLGTLSGFNAAFISVGSQLSTLSADVGTLSTTQSILITDVGTLSTSKADHGTYTVISQGSTIPTGVFTTTGTFII